MRLDLKKLGLNMTSPPPEEAFADYPFDRHRDERYEISSKSMQMWDVYRAQMKIYAKSYTPWMLAVLIALIPVLICSGVLDGVIIDSVRDRIGDTGETYVAICMGLVSVMSILISCILCGSTLPSELRYRTAYLNFPMPQSRTTFYFGKFLAGFNLAFATVLLAFAVSIVMAAGRGYASASFAAVGQSMAVALCGTFCFCSVAYGLSAFMSRGSTMFPFALLFMIVPIFALVLADSAGLSGAVGYVPSMSGDLALYYLGYDGSPSATMLLTHVDYVLSASAAGAAAVSVVCGVAFLLLGLSKTMRREI